jgi:CYTH domain-containing protein
MITNEIEKRFLMKRVPSAGMEKISIYAIEQFYSEDGWRYRDRLNALTGKSEYYKTKKKKAFQGFMEEEYEITEEEFRDANKPELPRISKTRTVYYRDGLKFEIDKFQHMDLVLMEVELESMSQEIQFPDFIKKEIICEVTGVKGLSNRKIALSELNR